MWYCFELISTIGFGEVVAITAAGKVLSVCLSFFSIAVIAIITSTIVNYYHLALRRQEDTDMIRIMKKLERLEELEKKRACRTQQAISRMAFLNRAPLAHNKRAQCHLNNQ